VSDDDLFRVRVAKNEVAFREVNESIRSGRQIADANRRFYLCCECGRIGCSKLIEVPLAVYEQVRSNPRRFFVLDGHEIPEVEDVVERHAEYLLVQKRDLGGRVAEANDPRSIT